MRRAVTFIQRFGDALNLNVHFHLLALDGVYAEDDNGCISFRPVAPPGDEEVTRVAERIARRFNLIRYSGVLAPSASWRPHVIPASPEPADDFNSHPGCKAKKQQLQNNVVCRSRRYAWAELLKRVFSGRYSEFPN